MISDPRNVVSIVQKGCYCSDITASCDLRYEPLCLLNGRQRSTYRLQPIFHYVLRDVSVTITSYKLT